jgi:hypothetical protein
LRIASPEYVLGEHEQGIPAMRLDCYRGSKMPHPRRIGMSATQEAPHRIGHAGQRKIYV